MPSKKKKYNARFPAGRIKKIMQTDEEVGKVAQAVPVIISRTLELFVESLLLKSVEVTNRRHAKTLSPSHVKQCILAESRFDFLKDLVKNIPDISHTDDREVSQNVSAENSPNSNRFAEAVNSTANPGPSNLRRPRQSQKKDNGQSSDSGSDHEPVVKRSMKAPYGNGRNVPKADFDDELKAFAQILKKSTDGDGSFATPTIVKAPSSGDGNRTRLFNFYTETLPDTSEDDDKDRIKVVVHSSVIQPNPEYSPNKNAKNFGFYAPANAQPKTETPDAVASKVHNSNSYAGPQTKNSHAVESNVFAQPQLSGTTIANDAAFPKIHIDLTKGFPMQTPCTVIASPSETPPVYHLDFSAGPIVNNKSPAPGRAAKVPPPLQTLKRSTSLPDPSMHASPAKRGERLRAAKDEAKPRMERTSHSFDSPPGARKNEPPQLLPINLIPKPTLLRTPNVEIDEDYDT